MGETLQVFLGASALVLSIGFTVYMIGRAMDEP